MKSGWFPGKPMIRLRAFGGYHLFNRKNVDTPRHKEYDKG
jgi:hypothetical protein